MKALCWHGIGDVRVDTVADPKIENPRDAIVRITASGICVRLAAFKDALVRFWPARFVSGSANVECHVLSDRCQSRYQKTKSLCDKACDYEPIDLVGHGATRVARKRPSNGYRRSGQLRKIG